MSRSTALLVELKTEPASRREIQDKYLTAASNAGFSCLVEGLLRIFHVTAAKRKYYHLLNLLAHAGLLHIPAEVHSIVRSRSLAGIETAAQGIRISHSPANTVVLYVQPNGHGSDTISFREFKTIVEAFGDPVSHRFARSLEEWSLIPAGRKASPRQEAVSGSSDIAS